MGASEIAVNNMPPNVEMIYSDMGSEIITGKAYRFKSNNHFLSLKRNLSLSFCKESSYIPDYLN